MRRLFVVAALVVAGCQNIVGPFQTKTPQRVDDPMLPIYEQQQRGRARLPVIEETFGQNYGDTEIAPPTYCDRPGVHGR